jgi:hypothetical protein
MSNQTSPYSLRFSLHTAQQSSLIIGLLELLKDGAVINSYQATSSLPGRQNSGSWKRKGGLIPPGKIYTVSVDPLWMPNVKGVEGSFYQIWPFEVPTDGAVRGDFGIHYDANSPGSLGCVVLTTQRGWDAFRRDMKKCGDVDLIPLEVIYL